MFRIKPKNVLSPIRSIEQEMLQTRARYEKYLKETSDNFVAKRSNIEIQDPHTMVGNAYWELRNEIDTLNNAAKNANKKVLIQQEFLSAMMNLHLLPQKICFHQK